MIERYRGGTVPEGGATSLDAAGAEALRAYGAAMDALDLKGGAEAAWGLVTAANQFIVQTAPWSLAKRQQDQELDAALAALARALIRLAVMAGPFMPAKAAELWDHLGQDAPVTAAWALATAPDGGGRRVRKPEGLFPKPSPPNP
jgi:methionyl-tRNA synthetase